MMATMSVCPAVCILVLDKKMTMVDELDARYLKNRFMSWFSE